MGVISIEQLLPSYLTRPDDAAPIGTAPAEIERSAMCIGFNPPTSDGEIIFEGETPVRLRFQERTWRYRQPSKDDSIYITNRWRFEVVADPAKTHLCPKHTVVVVQEPYGINWIQATKFKKYSKKSESERLEPVVPQLTGKEHPVDWMERNLEFDPWEKGAYYIAGIGYPNGFHEEPRNVTGKYVIGACPDFERLVQDISEKSPKIRKMLHLTRDNQINFWYSKAKIEDPPRLYPIVIEEAETLMYRSIEQALAGPSDSEEWTGRPVAELVRRIYCGHLNDANRREERRLLYEVPVPEQVKRTASGDLEQFEGSANNN